MEAGIEQQAHAHLKPLANEVLLQCLASGSAVDTPQMPGREFEVARQVLNGDFLRTYFADQAMDLNDNFLFAQGEELQYLLSQQVDVSAESLRHGQGTGRGNDGLDGLFLGGIHEKRTGAKGSEFARQVFAGR